VLVVVEDFIEKLRDVRPKGEGSHARAADLMRVDDSIGASLDELRFVLRV